MRKAIVFTLVAAVAIAIAAPQASAVSIPTGTELRGGIVDFSSVWDTSTGRW